MADFGNGATMTFGTSSYSLAWTSIDIGERTREVADISDLSTTGAKLKKPEDIFDSGSVRIRFNWVATAAMPVSTQTAETITVTWPIHTSGNTTNATYAGTGFVTAVKPPTLENGQIQEGEITVTWDGATDAAYTIESA